MFLLLHKYTTIIIENINKVKNIVKNKIKNKEVIPFDDIL
jgi:hypothetical protein